MNDFVKKLRELAKPKKKLDYYKYSDIEVRVYRDETEEGVNRKVGIYTNKTIDKKECEVIKRATNIEDERDFFEYKYIWLPGGRTGFGGYLYPKNLDRSKMDTYRFSDLYYKIFGEEIPSNRRFTIDELKGLLQTFKAELDNLKYQSIYEVKYKDSYKGPRAFNGSKYFAGVIEEHARRFEQINGNDRGIELEEYSSELRSSDISELSEVLLGLLPEYQRKKVLSDAELSEVYININGEQINLARCSNHENLRENEDSPLELVNLDTVYESSRIFGKVYYTNGAVRKVIEKREREKGGDR